ncbi:MULTISPECIES: LLM class flavin-dependent oxidoreductase [unclassified Pseudoclavibacter]|uniref:LLM class flavin-dependent oxidoreductase n=1 Tax=unclassified Pseudoclavibacter TaxID=2615177 RepID=UPI001300FAEB|nr:MULTISPECIES: LLM class flavin-dependent oxidoreductase [unclassified Pseudoclavibacter]KAB1644478.1 LLM class flavin-dependent oxidoreductase [Pseudoclavibacter sp. CFCC 14310]KAB1664018.1 LLM class flavin-dependent oxidoreductase [Pseudoclavibacter sp. CFCC 13611]
MTETHLIHIGVALEGAGWHPAAWREASSRPTELFDAGYWLDLVRIAQRGALDFVTIEDSLALQSSDRLRPDERTDEVRGRLDAVVLASRLAPVTEHIGLIPTATTTFTEPFHISKAIATLDFTSRGRAGVQPKLSLRHDEITHVGRREEEFIAALERIDTVDQLRDEADTAVRQAFDEAADFVEVLRRLWDSWEDDAEIRDVTTDRFIDADKLHTIDFESEAFSIRGPSITPRPPQGQPVVASLAHAQVPYEFAAQQADVIFTTPDAEAGAAGGSGTAEEVLASVRAAERETQRGGEPLRVYADLVILLDEASAVGETGSARLQRLDAQGRALRSDARIVTGSAAEVADLISALSQAGYDGVRLRPGVVTDDLPAIVDVLVPELRSRGLFRDAYPEHETLRSLLGLPTDVPSRYAGQPSHLSPAPQTALY